MTERGLDKAYSFVIFAAEIGKSGGFFSYQLNFHTNFDALKASKTIKIKRHLLALNGIKNTYVMSYCCMLFVRVTNK